MEKILKHLASLDWFVATATLGYGVVTWNWVIALIGGLSLLLAWYGPAKRIKKLLEKKLLVKAAKPTTTAQAIEAEQFYTDRLTATPDPDPAIGELKKSVPSYLAPTSAQMLGKWQLSASAHNQLKGPLLNLYNPPVVTGPVTAKVQVTTLPLNQPTN